ncbi:expressed unknown protein [Seminavis robusta]|uniref:Uncharacterized protein n=1 Tax=Seminavis robusta TaxID=568900 RepID=A0A9N8HQ66_9STRA|nr:expressed unknown protein [Seminavis robusta]|eukprot:Sro957_g224580.1 n/a (556) ;mRNA; f:35789-37456
MMRSSVNRQNRIVKAANKDDETKNDDTTKFAIISAKDFKPGNEGEVLESVHALLYSSVGILTHNINTAADRTSSWLSCQNPRMSDIMEEKMCDDVSLLGRNGGDLDGVVESMQKALEIMQRYQAKAHKAAKDFLEEQHAKSMSKQPIPSNLGERVAQADKEGGMWSLRDVKDMSTAEFFLGTLMPNQSTDEYPDGSDRLFPNSPLGPTTDAFLGSLSSFLRGTPSSNGKNKKRLMDSKLEYLRNVESVSQACHTQIEELDTILNNPSIAALYEIHENNTMNSVLTKDVEDEAAQHPQLNETAKSYIREARDKLAKYAAIAEKILKDEVKCMVTAYACIPEKCGEKEATAAAPEETENDGLFFESLRQHFDSDAYNIDFKSYLATENSGVMQMMLLNTLHSSLFLRNVGDKCQKRIRLHVGKEVSVSICKLVMTSLMSGKKDHRITEWGSLLCARHVRALHAYAYEFCRSTDGTRDLLSKVEVSTLDAAPMDSNWERLFCALDVLKLERLDDYDSSKLHSLFPASDAAKILRLRTEFEDDEIDAVLQPQKLGATKK